MRTGVRNNLDMRPDLSAWSRHGLRRARAPLTPSELGRLNQAGIQQKKILRTAQIAFFNGTCMAIFAAISLISGIFDTMSLAMGLVLAGLAWNEFRGRKLLRNMDLAAPRVLGWNQLAFMGLLICYSAWHIYFGLTGPSAYQAEIAAYPQLDSMVGITRLEKTITVSIYSALIAAAIICQGGCAWYYFNRTKHLHAYVSDTDPWIIDIHRTTGGA